MDRQVRRAHRVLRPDAAVRRADLADRATRRNTGSSSCSGSSSALRAARSPSARPTSRAGFRGSGRASRWASSAPATPARPSTSSSRRRSSWRSAGRWCRRCTRRSCWAPRCCSGSSAIPIPPHLVDSKITWREQLLALKDPKVWKLLPVLLDRVRRLRRAVAVDGPVLRRRIRLRHPRCGAAGRVLLAARRRAARRRRLVLRQIRRAQRDLVGAVGRLVCLFLLSYPQTDITIQTIERPEDLSHRSERLAVHRPDVRAGHRLGVRQGIGLQVHLRRLSRQHRRDLAASSAWRAAWAASCCRSCSAR